MAALSTFSQFAVTTQFRTAAGLERRTSTRLCCGCIGRLVWGARGLLGFTAGLWVGAAHINVQKAKPKEYAQAYALPAAYLKGPEERDW